VGAAVVCQGCQSLVPAVRPFGGSRLVSVPVPVAVPDPLPVPSAQGGREACAGPSGSSVPSTQPSCSQGGRSGVRVMAGPGALLAGSVPSAVGAAASCGADVPGGASAPGGPSGPGGANAPGPGGADAPGGSQPGTESPA
jgi:hypothetical protein